MNGTKSKLRSLVLLLAIGLIVSWSSGCSVYFNTFFNARKAFNKAEETRKEANRAGAGARDYQIAIEKCQKVVDNHPNSKYYDDAVFILGVSYYYTGQYGRAERRFRELLADYPDSKFTKEARLYLAKAKLDLGDIDEAKTLFEDIFRSDYSKGFKVDAAKALGKYHYDAKEYTEAIDYFRAIRDSLGSGPDVLEAQLEIADAYYDAFRFKDALGSYLHVTTMEPDTKQRYHAYYRAARCAFALQRINDGLAYLDKLEKDELYYDSLGSLKLAKARGYESNGDIDQAEDIFRDVAETSEVPVCQATANYRLGLIYQIEYDRLKEAKEFYDKSSGIGGQSSVRGDAIQRSADIGKLDRYARTVLDTSSTQSDIDDAAYTQFQLAELYWLKLNKPDSAIKEMRYLVDSMPRSYFQPKGMIALAEMIRAQEGDDRTADSLLKAVLREYPHSDFLPEALGALGLAGTAADTGYAEVHVRKAERYLVDEEKPDSARAEYQYVVDNFPESKYFIPSTFNLIWITENYFSPGDSSLITAYQDFADSFPSDPLALEALTRIRSEKAGALAQTQRALQRQEELAEQQAGKEDTAAQAAQEEADTSTYVDPKVALYHGPDGDTLVDLRLDPIETLEPFEFPDEAATVDIYEWRLYFQVLIDFSGRVIDFVLKIPSGYEEIDRRAMESVGSMTFDAASVSNRAVSAGLTDQPESDGRWFVYEFIVEKPDYLR